MSEGTSFNPAKRRLCPDGACIGVVGDDGRCRVCGIGASGASVGVGAAGIRDTSGGDGDREELEEREDREAGNGVGDAHADADADGGTGDGGMTAGRHAPGGAGGFRPDRRLCDDGSCIGVVGADGVCAVCGRRAES